MHILLSSIVYKQKIFYELNPLLYLRLKVGWNMHRRLWEEHITYFIEVNKIQIYPIRSLIVTHYSVWSILHNYPQCWQTICSVKVNKLQIALWNTAQHLQILGLASIARHQCLEAKCIFSCEWIDVLQLKFLENYTPNYLNTF